MTRSRVLHLKWKCRRLLGAVSQSSPSIDPDDSRSSLVDPILALRLKVLELKLSRQEHQNQLLQLQGIELQTDRQVKLKELELRANEWRLIPIFAGCTTIFV